MVQVLSGSGLVTAMVSYRGFNHLPMTSPRHGSLVSTETRPTHKADTSDFCLLIQPEVLGRTYGA